MTKRQWVIVQQAMSAYADTIRYSGSCDIRWDDDDGPLPSGGEIDRTMMSLAEIVGHEFDDRQEGVSLVPLRHDFSATYGVDP